MDLKLKFSLTVKKPTKSLTVFSDLVKTALTVKKSPKTIGLPKTTRLPKTFVTLDNEKFGTYRPNEVYRRLLYHAMKHPIEVTEVGLLRLYKKTRFTDTKDMILYKDLTSRKVRSSSSKNRTNMIITIIYHILYRDPKLFEFETTDSLRTHINQNYEKKEKSLEKFLRTAIFSFIKAYEEAMSKLVYNVISNQDKVVLLEPIESIITTVELSRIRYVAVPNLRLSNTGTSVDYLFDLDTGFILILARPRGVSQIFAYSDGFQDITVIQRKELKVISFYDIKVNDSNRPPTKEVLDENIVTTITEEKQKKVQTRKKELFYLHASFISQLKKPDVNVDILQIYIDTLRDILYDPDVYITCHMCGVNEAKYVYFPEDTLQVGAVCDSIQCKESR